MMMMMITANMHCGSKVTGGMLHGFLVLSH